MPCVWPLRALHVDFIVQADLVARQPPNSPSMARRFEDGHLNVVRRDAGHLMDALIELPDEMFFGFDRPTFKNAYLDNDVTV